MGKIITFWSPYHGQCGTTATTIALAGASEVTSVVTHIQPFMSNMENMLGLSEQIRSGCLNDTGLNNLIYNITARPLEEQDIKSAAIKITGHLSLLSSLGQNKNDVDKDALILHVLTKELPKYYKNVFIDLGTETRALAKEIQKAADTNFVVLSQNRMLWKEYSDIPKVRYLISNYDKDSKYTVRHFRFVIAKRADGVPHCTEYMDAIASGEVRDFLLRNENLENANKNDDAAMFFQALKGVKLN